MSDLINTPNKRYTLPEWLGGHMCHLVAKPDPINATVCIWRDGRPSNDFITVDRNLLTEIDPPDMPTAEQVLATPMSENDAGAATIGEYLAALLHGVWREQEGFNGKRPFGNSSWHHDVLQALGASGYIRYDYDEHGCCKDYDKVLANRLIHGAIDAMAERR